MSKQPALPTTLLSTTLLLLLVLLFTPLTTAEEQQWSNCTGFTWDKEPPSESPALPVRVSAAKTCPADEPCSLVSTGYESYLANFNVTGKALNVELLTTAVANSVPNGTIRGDGFNNSVRGSVENTYPMRAGQSGYLNVTVKRQCFNGTLSDCTGDGGVKDGTGIRICAPIWTYRGDDVRFSMMDWAVQNVSAEDVDKYPDPYAGQQNDGDDEGGALRVMAGMNGGLLAVLVGLVAVIVV